MLHTAREVKKLLQMKLAGGIIQPGYQLTGSDTAVSLSQLDPTSTAALFISMAAA